MRLCFSSFNLLSITCSLLLSPILQLTGAALENAGSLVEGQVGQASTTSQSTAPTIDRAIGTNAVEQIAEADRLLQQGLQQYDAGQFESALSIWQQTLSLYQEQSVREAFPLRSRQGEGNSIFSIGLVYARLAQDSQAQEYYQQALAIFRELDNRGGEGTVLSFIAAIYESQGQYPQVLEYRQQVLAIAQETGDRVILQVALANMGGLYGNLGQPERALDYFQQALVVNRATDDRQSEGKILNNIGLSYLGTGEYSQAQDYFQQALTIARATSNRSLEGYTLANLGLIYGGQGQYPQAIESLQQTLVISREVRDQWLEGLTLNNLGWIYAKLGQYSEAYRYLEQAWVIAKANDIPALQGWSLTNISLVFLLSGKPNMAARASFAAISVQNPLLSSELSDTDQVSLFTSQTGAYGLLQQALIAQNQTESALLVSEFGRAKALEELLSRRLSVETGSQPSAVAFPSIDQIKQIAQAQNATLVQYSLAFAFVQVEGQIEWRPSKINIWVIAPTGQISFRSVDLPVDGTLSKLVEDSRSQIGARGRDATTADSPAQSSDRSAHSRSPALRELHQLLIEPIADLLPANPSDHVIFIPYDSLLLVPFPALLDANGDFLIQSHTILTAPSIQVLGLTHQLQREPAIEPSQVLVAGNPTMPPLPAIVPQPPLARLPGAEQEAIVIAGQFHTQPLLGDAATETAVVQRMQTARLIHLATHGLLEYGDPRASGVRDMPGAIALAPSAQDDGLLTASEISNLNLSADLVVLSACNTARGDITGDGVIGLSRALISAGVPSVIVSLWTVPDDSTEALMSEFYRRLRQQPDKAQALRQAMLQTMQEFPNPIDWAAFTLIGEAE